MLRLGVVLEHGQAELLVRGVVVAALDSRQVFTQRGPGRPPVLALVRLADQIEQSAAEQEADDRAERDDEHAAPTSDRENHAAQTIRRCHPAPARASRTSRPAGVRILVASADVRDRPAARRNSRSLGTYGSGPRRRRIGLGLTWAATGLAGSAALVSLILVGRMEDILLTAVSEGRALPFTGEADEQAILPFLLAGVFIALFVATAALGYMLRGWAYHGEHIGTSLLAAALIVVIALAAPVVLPLSLAGQQYIYDLYGWWYFPFLIAVAVSYVCCLAGSALVLIRSRSAAMAREA